MVHASKNNHKKFPAVFDSVPVMFMLTWFTLSAPHTSTQPPSSTIALTRKYVSGTQKEIGPIRVAVVYLVISQVRKCVIHDNSRKVTKPDFVFWFIFTKDCSA